MPNTEGIFSSLGNEDRPLAKGVYTLRLTLPGVNREDILVAFRDGCVEVHGRGKTESMEEGPGIVIYQAEELSAYHRVPLPPDADTGAAVVKLADGEALIEIPSRRRP
ncbi:MAG: Hsp20/alpha crystallin family protein [Bacteroidota bacterium]